MAEGVAPTWRTLGWGALLRYALTQLIVRDLVKIYAGGGFVRHRLTVSNSLSMVPVFAVLPLVMAVATAQRVAHDAGPLLHKSRQIAVVEGEKIEAVGIRRHAARCVARRLVQTSDRWEKIGRRTG